jgi:hypothetical protein
LPSYETGGNQLFDHRLEHVVVHDPKVKDKLQLPDKKPDRVVGLQETKAFEEIFEEFSKEFGDEEVVNRLTPFNDTLQPLLLPFLILEAKSERSADGFKKALVQTALPIWALLRLQEDVRVRASGDLSNTAPLVWYFANRGDSWRVYGCYITSDTPEKYVSELPCRLLYKANCHLGDRATLGRLRERQGCFFTVAPYYRLYL